MAFKFPNFVKKQGDALVFDGEGEFIFYIPEVYFDRGNAIIKGEYINLIGVLDYAVFDKNGKTSGLKAFRFPTVFLTKPSKIEKQKNVKLTAHTEPTDLRLLRYSKGDPIMVSTSVPQNIVNVEEFFKIFRTGKLPTTIPIDKMHEYFTDSIEYNGSSFGLALQVFGFFIGEYCRSKKDLTVPFRLSKYTDPTSYQTINISDLPKYVAPFSSFTSETWDNALVGSMVTTDGPKSPMEKILMEESLY